MWVRWAHLAAPCRNTCRAFYQAFCS